jgi:hypothetical protein
MNIYSSFRKTMHIIILIPFMVVLIACSGNAVSASSTSGTQDSSTLLTNLGSSPPIFVGERTFTSTGVSFHLGPHSCPGRLGVESSFPSQNIVLKSRRLTYDELPLQQMKEYLLQNDPFGTGGIGKVALPDTLNLAQGGLTSQGKNQTSAGTFVSSNCVLSIDITNQSASTITLEQAGIQRVTAQQNSYQYRLIDICPLVQRPQCIPAIGGPFTDFSATITLNQANSKARFVSDIVGEIPDSTAPQGIREIRHIPILPYQTSRVDITINSQYNMIYSITPLITIGTSQGLQNFVLSSFSGAIAFANVNQISCYTLKDHSFELIKANDTNSALCI